MTYQPIEDYGIIGDLHTVALVGRDGSIDWFCYPAFDSPSVFAALLDDERGGSFRIDPRCEVTRRQMYWPETNVLVTRFLSDDGVAEIRDFMPLGRAGGHGAVVRVVHVVRGVMAFDVECRPAFDYARADHEIRIVESGALFRSGDLCLGLGSTVDLEADGPAARGRFGLRAGGSAVFELRGLDRNADTFPAPSREETEEAFGRTVDFWRQWLARSQYRGRWREMVHRSALALKLLTYEPTGAIVASPTCSLPEGIGGQRNWDYRYTWIRDAAFTVYAFLRLGFTSEAARFMDWIEERVHELGPEGSLQVMYGIDGRHELTEETLDHLKGYRESTPVRIGNAAYDQLQLDIYGALLDAIYLYNKYGSPISWHMWKHVTDMVAWVTDNWRRRDKGVWEVRGEGAHFTYSKLMCWVALDRAVRLADKRSFPADRAAWLAERDEIYRQIMEKGWNEARGAFVQHYDTDALDASNLIMPLVFFVSPTDDRMLRTIEAIMQRPEKGGLVSDSLVYRYHPSERLDELEGEEGTFNICTFWLVEALTRAGRTQGRHSHLLDTARLIFEQMLGYANHVGLYAEETGPAGEALGNFPQAFTHLSLISAAWNLDEALGGGD